MRLRVATCVVLPEPDPDRAPLDAALAAAGVDFEVLAWDDPSVDWDAPIATVIRSTWNYIDVRDEFLRWCERVARAAPLWNPPDVIRASTDKRYLLELAARGVAVVPSVLIEAGEPPRIAEHAARHGWQRVVVKPAIGAGSVGVEVFDAGRFDDADHHAAALARRGGALVQPYLDSIDSHGERSQIWIDGELSHQIRKAPRFAGASEQITGPFPIADDERAVALAAIAPWADRILYGRIDLARGAGGEPLVMELELAEPSLYFAHGPGSVERYVAGVIRRLRQAG